MKWKKQEVKELRRLFKERSTAYRAGYLRRPLEAVKKKASRLGLKKSKKYLKSIGHS